MTVARCHLLSIFTSITHSFSNYAFYSESTDITSCARPGLIDCVTANTDDLSDCPSDIDDTLVDLIGTFSVDDSPFVFLANGSNVALDNVIIETFDAPWNSNDSSSGNVITSGFPWGLDSDEWRVYNNVSALNHMAYVDEYNASSTMYLYWDDADDRWDIAVGSNWPGTMWYFCEESQLKDCTQGKWATPWDGVDVGATIIFNNISYPIMFGAIGGTAVIMDSVIDNDVDLGFNDDDCTVIANDRLSNNSTMIYRLIMECGDFEISDDFNVEYIWESAVTQYVDHFSAVKIQIYPESTSYFPGQYAKFNYLLTDRLGNVIEDNIIKNTTVTLSSNSFSGSLWINGDGDCPLCEEVM